MKDEALRMALEALESYKNFTEDAHVIEGQWHWLDGTDKAVTAIKQALAAPVQEPLAWMTQARNFVHVMEFTEAEAKLYGWMPLYTTPPNVATPLAAQRQWVGLTDEQVVRLFNEVCCGKPFDVHRILDLYQAIEVKLKEKNT